MGVDRVAPAAVEDAEGVVQTLVRRFHAADNPTTTTTTPTAAIAYTPESPGLSKTPAVAKKITARTGASPRQVTRRRGGRVRQRRGDRGDRGDRGGRGGRGGQGRERGEGGAGEARGEGRLAELLEVLQDVLVRALQQLQAELPFQVDAIDAHHHSGKLAL